MFLVRRADRAALAAVGGGRTRCRRLALLAYMPYTYSGGGGPIGNRYFLSFYPLFLFLMPRIASALPAIIGLAVGRSSQPKWY